MVTANPGQPLSELTQAARKLALGQIAPLYRERLHCWNQRLDGGWVGWQLARHLEIAARLAMLCRHNAERQFWLNRCQQVIGNVMGARAGKRFGEAGDARHGWPTAEYSGKTGMPIIWPAHTGMIVAACGLVLETFLTLVHDEGRLLMALSDCLAGAEDLYDNQRRWLKYPAGTDAPWQHEPANQVAAYIAACIRIGRLSGKAQWTNLGVALAGTLHDRIEIHADGGAVWEYFLRLEEPRYSRIDGWSYACLVLDAARECLGIGRVFDATDVQRLVRMVLRCLGPSGFTARIDGSGEPTDANRLDGFPAAWLAAHDPEIGRRLLACWQCQTPRTLERDLGLVRLATSVRASEETSNHA